MCAKSLKGKFNEKKPTQSEIDKFVNGMARGGQDANIETFLTKYPQAVNAQMVHGWSALMLAAANGHMSTVKLLLKKGADPTVATFDSKARTALQFAEREGQRDIAEVLKNAVKNWKATPGQPKPSV